MIARVLAALLALLPSAACNSPQGPPIPKIAAEINATLVGTEEVIGPGDLLDVSFVNFTELTLPDPSYEDIVVPRDGRVQFPGLGVVRVAGRTPSQVVEILIEGYKPLMGGNAPSVSVVYSEQAQRTFHVLGAVRRPGEFPIDPDGRVTLVEAFARAGGVTYLASYMGNVLLVRWDGASQRQVAWVIDARDKWWGEPETILLQANDVVFVPDTTIAKVNTWMERYIIRMIPFPRFFIPVAA